MYSREQEIKVQEGGDRPAGQSGELALCYVEVSQQGEDSAGVQWKHTWFTLPTVGSTGMNIQLFHLAQVKVQLSPDPSEADNFAAWL